MIEEGVFQTLSVESVIKRPHYTYFDSTPDEFNDFLTLAEEIGSYHHQTSGSNYSRAYALNFSVCLVFQYL